MTSHIAISVLLVTCMITAVVVGVGAGLGIPVNGLTVKDPGYRLYVDPSGTEFTPYNDFLMNGCLTGPLYGNDTTVTMDTIGLEELGMFYYDINTCFDFALGIQGYNISKIEPYKITTDYGSEKDMMRITLVKQY